MLFFFLRNLDISLQFFFLSIFINYKLLHYYFLGFDKKRISPRNFGKSSWDRKKNDENGEKIFNVHGRNDKRKMMDVSFFFNYLVNLIFFGTGSDVLHSSSTSFTSFFFFL